MDEVLTAAEREKYIKRVLRAWGRNGEEHRRHLARDAVNAIFGHEHRWGPWRDAEQSLQVRVCRDCGDQQWD